MTKNGEKGYTYRMIGFSTWSDQWEWWWFD